MRFSIVMPAAAWRAFCSIRSFISWLSTVPRRMICWPCGSTWMFEATVDSELSLRSAC
jgi:hypothetical protein